jgi:hypothetical protein
MASLNGGFNSDEHKSNLFPEGRFRFLISSSELVDAKKENVVVGQDWEFKLICISEPHMNRPLTRRLAYARHSTAPNVKQQLDIGKAQIADICRAVNVLKPNDTSELNDKQFEADVKIKGDFNNLSKIKAIVSGSSPSPSQQPATAGATKPGGW